MTNIFFVRVGLFGQVGRFQPLETHRYTRGMRVVCRTSRGLEVGEVLSPLESHEQTTLDGQIVRRMSVEDDLMLSRLERDKAQALQRCSEVLHEHGSTVAILDAEILLDGGGLYFYFLGDHDAALASATELLAETYQAEVQFRQFADTLEQGCGPACGTEEGGGCGYSCGSCAVSSACKVSALAKK